MIEQLARTRLARALPRGMELSHFMVLNHFARLGGEKTPAQLARMFHVTKGAMTQHAAQARRRRATSTSAPTGTTPGASGSASAPRGRRARPGGAGDRAGLRRRARPRRGHRLPRGAAGAAGDARRARRGLAGKRRLIQLTLAGRVHRSKWLSEAVGFGSMSSHDPRLSLERPRCSPGAEMAARRRRPDRGDQQRLAGAARLAGIDPPEGLPAGAAPRGSRQGSAGSGTGITCRRSIASAAWSIAAARWRSPPGTGRCMPSAPVSSPSSAAT